MRTEYREKILKNTTVANNNECWNWTASINNCGYGRFGYIENGKRRGMNAHRASYMAFVDNKIDGLMILHKCDNRKCVNPKHLFTGTAKTNAFDRDTKGRGAWKNKTWKPPGLGIYKGDFLVNGRGCIEVACALCGKKNFRTPYETKRSKRTYCSGSCAIKHRWFIGEMNKNILKRT